MNPESDHPALGFSARIVSMFLQGPLPLLVILMALIAGLVALRLTPREEEPQIVVPLADVIVSAPGLSAAQVERQIATPLEKLLYQIDGVEYVYSMSSQSRAIVTVRFHVGEERENSLIKIYNKVFSNTDLVPASVTSWIVKPVEIDDVPIVIATLWSEDPERTNDHGLRRLAEEIELSLQSIPDTNQVTITGGRPRVIRVEIEPESLAARRTTPLDIIDALRIHNTQLPSGGIERDNIVFEIEAGAHIEGVEALRDLPVNVVDGVPVYLKDVATIIDGPDEVANYTWIGFGPAAENPPSGGFYPAVNLAVAKKKGSNAVWVARDVQNHLDELKKGLFPPEVHCTLTRNYGQTANDKVSELVEALAVAILTVVIFIGLVLGWRAALVVALAVPVCYGATLLINLLAGYTINRVTLFALILALGLLVDDPITDVENIARFFKMGRHKPRMAVLLAVQEVRPALIMSTIAIILSFLPMFFITGMMGPYMAPMALNVPLTVVISTIVAFCVTPYLARVFLKVPRRDSSDEDAGNDVRRAPLYRIYNFCLRPLLRHRWAAWTFLGTIMLLFAAAVILPALRLVPLKMLPFDNKNEFQVLIDLPEGATLETTQALAADLARQLQSVPEVVNVTGYAGTASPMDFNGMVRHYFLRQGQNVGDLRVNLLPKKERAQQSHELLLRIRRDLEAVAAGYPGAVIKLVELPPGPPVISTVTAEIHGEPDTPYWTLQAAAEVTARRLEKEPFVVDVDTSVEADSQRLLFVTDKEKAALSGIGTQQIAQTLALAASGLDAITLNIPSEAHPLPVVVRLPRERRSDPLGLSTLSVMGRPGIMKIREGASLRDAPTPLVQLGEIGEFKRQQVDKTIYHKNLERVAYVYAETAGRAPADIVLDVGADLEPDALPVSQDGQGYTLPENKKDSDPRPLDERTYFSLGGGIPWQLPAGTQAVWTGEGEWKITLDVFRDLGLAFAAALVGIFIVLMIQTGSTVIALIMMTAIPLTMIGIMPGFWLLNVLGDRSVAGLPNPVFFTATAMIGMIALAGIVVRNSVILIDFIHMALREGMDIEESLIQSGAIRMRPIFLTAGVAMLGNIVITLDPIFSGLAWAIIFGVAASTLFTLGVIPVVYHLVYAHKPGHGLPDQAVTDD